MAFADAIGSERDPREQETILQSCFRLHVRSNEDLGFVASLLRLHKLRVRIELAHETVSVFFCGCGNVGNKGLDEVPAGSTQSFRTAEIRGVRFNKSWIEVVLADQEAEAVPQTCVTIA
jgi:hypothetical protein